MIFRPAERIAEIRQSAIRRIFDKAEPDAINLGLGQPDFATPAVIRKAAIRFLDKGRVQYTTNAGMPALRKAIARYYGNRSENMEVCVTNGSAEALYLTLMALINPGDEILLPNPGYVAYPAIVRLVGGKPVYYKLASNKGFRFDLKDFHRKITNKTRVVILSSPSNPTSLVLRPEECQAISNLLKDTDIFTVSDEIYRDLYFETRPVSISEYRQESIVISGLSKSCAMTGWRLGWVYGNSGVIRHLTALHQYINTCASTVSQYAALEAFSKEGMAAQQKMRQDLKTCRQIMIDAIDSELKLERTEPEGGFYVMIQISRYGHSFDVAEYLLDHKVITVPGAAFGSEGEGYLRLSFATDSDNIREGIRRIKTGLVQMEDHHK